MQKSFLALLVMILFFIPGARAEHTPPFYDEIMKIMEPLQYSGVEVLVKPQAGLSVDFQKRTWSLRNVHEYDSKGDILLAQGRYGLCAELATYLYEKIQDLLAGGRYVVKFAMANESGFFGGRSNHIVLLLADKANGEIYLIDPSFHKYARRRDLPEYHVLNIQDSLSFVRDKSHDVSFGVDQATPLYIKKDVLLTFSVTSVDGKFDRSNFLIVISANQRGKFQGRDIVLIGRRNKEFVDVEDKAVLTDLLSEEEINVLFGKLKIWMEELS